MDTTALTAALGIDARRISGGDLAVQSPIDGSVLGHVHANTEQDVGIAAARAEQAFAVLRMLPAPKRGELIRLFGQVLRAHKDDLATLVTLECGKIRQEALGEVQEMIDICDFAVGLSRQLYGLTIASERPLHRMMEQWHPLGPVAVISAFNFPVAVWAWNFCLAVVCGDSVVWKPSEKTPLCALACQALWERAISGSDAPAHVSQVVVGGREVGALLGGDARFPLVSATGSTRMGRELAPVVAARFGRSLLELGGNNAMIVAPSADLDLAVRAIVFSAVGTAGQRCTSLRRLIVHADVHDALLDRLAGLYEGIPVGDPREDGVLVGPLIDPGAYTRMQQAMLQAEREAGRKVCGGERVHVDARPDGFYVRPALFAMPTQTPVVTEETFAPLLYAMAYRSLDEALELHNAVPQGLSSCIFTGDLREAELFLSPRGSDCGIANVNIGPSGAEIGGAFGGEKATGGGRESGSDAWKNYMRRATNTINYSSELPLAQGIRFDVTRSGS